MLMFAYLLDVCSANTTSVVCAPTIRTSCQDPNVTCSSIFSVTSPAAVVASGCTATNDTETVQCTCLPTATSSTPSPVSNSSLTVTVVRNVSTSVCTWNSTVDLESSASSTSSSGSDEDFVGFVCTPSSGLCPTRADCRNSSSPFASTCLSGSLTCETPEAGVRATVGTLTNITLVLSCYACDGSSVAMYVEEASGRCVKDYSAPPSTSTCTPSTTCHGHGCCAPLTGVVTDANPAGTCYCYSDSIRGYWSASSSCSQCDSSHDSQGTGGACTNTKSQIVVLLQSLGATSPAVMILPNLLIIVFFVIFGTIRPVWSEDANFHLTALRRAGLSWSPQAKRLAVGGHDEAAEVMLPIFREPFRKKNNNSKPSAPPPHHHHHRSGDPSAARVSPLAASSPTAAGVNSSMSAPSTPHDDDDLHPHAQPQSTHPLPPQQQHTRVGSTTSAGQHLHQLPRSGVAAAAAGAGGSAAAVGGEVDGVEYMRFHAKVIPPRPRGSVGIVARWEAIRHARM
ncbi:transmembrane protein, putative [Bodo saltans]|uniref:Transmembrane protein, putative n=1 Tax=Bodo saltans TaxID=75058 RepID=A0A0S4J147_BODSA|nr:transmembrane protein, putative [Bodo saltans]|eukprot:CUG78009.1 transmembrane protein, putative [Bodo saltans]